MQAMFSFWYLCGFFFYKKVIKLTGHFKIILLSFLWFFSCVLWIYNCLIHCIYIFIGRYWRTFRRASFIEWNWRAKNISGYRRRKCSKKCQRLDSDTRMDTKWTDMWRHQKAIDETLCAVLVHRETPGIRA